MIPLYAAPPPFVVLLREDVREDEPLLIVPAFHWSEARAGNEWVRIYTGGLN